MIFGTACSLSEKYNFTESYEAEAPVPASSFPLFMRVPSFGFIAGNSMTSLMLLVSVRSMQILSTPHPQPPVGGRPYSRAVTKLMSTCCASRSPASFAAAYP